MAQFIKLLMISELIELSRQFGKTELRMFLLELTNYQDNLLQTYRNIFIASQTIVISIAILIVASVRQRNPTFIFLLIIGAFIILYWKKITYSRGLDVSYCHMQLEKVEAEIRLTSDERRKPFWSFKDWQHKSVKDKERILKGYDKKHNRDIFESYTREIMGTKLPFIFSIVWVLIFLIFIINL